MVMESFRDDPLSVLVREEGSVEFGFFQCACPKGKREPSGHDKNLRGDQYENFALGSG